MFKYTVEGRKILAINALELERVTLIEKWTNEDEEIEDNYKLIDCLYSNEPIKHQEFYLITIMNYHNIKKDRQTIIKKWNIRRLNL